MAEDTAPSHFAKRAERYNKSSNWVSDESLVAKMYEMSEADSNTSVLDLASGTGQVARGFHGKVGKLTGLDITPEMVEQNKFVDEMVIGSAYELPFEENTFDLCICRQGLQFMELDKALPEVLRVLKPGGKVVFAHLTSFGEEDKEDTFLTQKLRNPARINFLVPGDMPAALEKNGYKVLDTYDYKTREAARQWLDNGAITEERIQEAFSAYRNANDAFKKLHEVVIEENDIFDTMNMQIVKAQKA